MNAVTPIGFVMIADDDLDDIEILTTALKEAYNDLEVVVAGNGKSVLEHLKKARQSGIIPCVLVMDLNMPQMDGRETVVAIKGDAYFSNLPILLFSTAKNRTDELFAEKWGVRYFQKPDTVQGLNDVAKTIITLCQEKIQSL
jgi:CheY-like chemotaxis protein